MTSKGCWTDLLAEEPRGWIERLRKLNVLIGESLSVVDTILGLEVEEQAEEWKEPNCRSLKLSAEIREAECEMGTLLRRINELLELFGGDNES